MCFANCFPKAARQNVLTFCLVSNVIIDAN